VKAESDAVRNNLDDELSVFVASVAGDYAAAQEGNSVVPVEWLIPAAPLVNDYCSSEILDLHAEGEVLKGEIEDLLTENDWLQAQLDSCCDQLEVQYRMIINLN